MEIKKNVIERAVHFVETKWLAVSDWYHRHAHGPLSWIVRTIAAIGRWYRDSIWMRFAENKDGKRTAKRMAGTIAATLLVLWMLPSIFLATWQASLMLFTFERETVYLTAAEEVDPSGDIHAIRGCRAIPCNESDSIYFRVRPTWMHDIYSLWTRGSVFYPDYVASVVAPGVNKCEVSSYGIRIRALMRGWDIFPEMLDASCTPYETDRQFSRTDPAS